jgi:hypothetical protein
VKAEIRGRASNWRVFYPNEAGLATPVAVFDQDGVLKDAILVGSPPDEKGNGMVEAYGVCTSVQEAEEYARYLGATEISVKRTLTKTEALAKARAKKREASDE